MTKEMFPDWSILRFDWPQRGVHPPLSIYWYDGGKTPPKEVTRGKRGMIWIGTKGRLPSGPNDYPAPPPRDWNRKGVYQDWVTAAIDGKQAPCHFGYAGPFTEAYQLGNIALHAGHRIEWDPLAFRITNCREANEYLHKEERPGWELKKIAGAAWA